MDWNRPPSVGWCEFVVQGHAYSPWVGEFWNTISSLIYCVVGAVGLERALRLGLPAAFAFTEVVLIVVGLGSAAFHATETFIGQLLDELPMSVMGCGYLWCMRHRHWLTSRPYDRLYITLNHMLVAYAWVAYLVYREFEIFVLCFTLQVAITGFMSLAAGDAPLLSEPRFLWWVFLSVTILGKGLWEYERWLNSKNACPRSESDWRFWLHPLWHLLSACAHHSWMRYTSSLELVKEKST